MHSFSLSIQPLKTLPRLAMAANHYLLWLRAHSFPRQRDPFFTDPPIAA